MGDKVCITITTPLSAVINGVFDFYLGPITLCQRTCKSMKRERIAYTIDNTFFLHAFPSSSYSGNTKM